MGPLKKIRKLEENYYIIKSNKKQPIYNVFLKKVKQIFKIKKLTAFGLKKIQKTVSFINLIRDYYKASFRLLNLILLAIFLR
jgi:hypothetical protein